MLKNYVICYDKIKAHPDMGFLSSKFNGVSGKQIKSLVLKQRKILNLKSV